MFLKLGNLINRLWPGLLLGWIGVLVVAAVMAPPLWDVVQTEEFAFLPASSPSLVGETLFREAFPKTLVPSRVVIVVSRPDGGLTEQDKEWVDDGVNESDATREFELRERLLKIAEDAGGLAAGPDGGVPDDEDAAAENKPLGIGAGTRSLISAVRTFRDTNLGRLILSADGKSTLVLVDLTTDFLDARNQKIVAKIQELILDKSEKNTAFHQKIPAGLELSLSGDATVGRDMQAAARDSAKATETLTIGLVVFLLIAIYRAPLLALIPLITVFVSVKLSMSLLILLAQRKLAILFPGAETYVTVLVYGAGVDYCLFLIDRYKEELDEGTSFDEAAANCVAKVGAAIAASAGTVICGIGMMMFAEFGKFRQAGFAISFGLIVVLLASLTFSLLAADANGACLIHGRMVANGNALVAIGTGPLVAEYLGCGRASSAPLPHDRLAVEHCADAAVRDSGSDVLFASQLWPVVGSPRHFDQRAGHALGARALPCRSDRAGHGPAEKRSDRLLTTRRR